MTKRWSVIDKPDDVIITDEEAAILELQSTDIDSSSDDEVDGNKLSPYSSPIKIPTWKATINIASYTLGVGMLAMPYAVAQGGITAILFLFVIPFIYWFANKVIIECLYDQDKPGRLERARVRTNWKEIGEVLSPKYGGFIAIFLQNFILFIVSTSYLILCGSLMAHILPSLPISQALWTCITAIIVFPTTLFKSYSQIAWLSVFGIVTLFATVGAIIWHSMAHMDQWDITVILFWDSEGVLMSLGILLYSYAFFELTPSIENSMENRSQLGQDLQLVQSRRKDMTPLPLWFIISASMLLFQSSFPVQGKVIDVQSPPGKFNEAMADTGISACFSHAVGVANSSIIPDKQMTASTYYSSDYKPGYGRLNFNEGAWCASSPSRDDEWLQVDLGQLYKVCGVATQGEGYFDEWVKGFQLSYSQDGKYWIRYKEKNNYYVYFYRKGKSNTVDQHKLEPFYARYVRFEPIWVHGWNCLRMEVYGTGVEINNVSPSDCGTKSVSKRIVGGQHASPGEWPWHVEVRAGGSMCSGSLLTPQWAITAAHCVKRYNAADVKLTLGEHNSYKVSGKEQVHSISKYIMHPQYVFSGYDFALMKLTKPATINDHVGTICLPESTERLPDGTVLWETGWGRISHGGRFSDVLKELEVKIVPRDSDPRDNIHYSEFITTATQEGHGTCRGDSGGPVVHERNGRWYLEGVHSWGRPTCAEPGYYDGQADVRAALPWIADTIKNN
ncbi:hypothetical protein ACROYT_G016238 [Oculina patagonica]